MKNKHKIFIALLFFFALFSAGLFAQDSTKANGQEGNKQEFVDLDGDGYNDNAADHDGDGIPNGLDPDWHKLQKENRKKFIDLDGDGINDNLQHTHREQKGEKQLIDGNGSPVEKGKNQNEQNRKRHGNKR